MRKTRICQFFLLGLLALACLLSGCGGKTSNQAGLVRFLISKDYGQEQILDKTIELKKGMTVLDGLYQTGALVKTAYGGEYVAGIEGYLSQVGGAGGERNDWFYYVNGIFTPVGALDYYPQAGDIVWWDYHSWSTAQVVTALVGSFPEPFLNGFEGEGTETIILYPEGFKTAARELEDILRSYGVQPPQVQMVQNCLLAHRESPTILVGPWEKLRDLPFMADLNKAYQRSGTFCHFGEEGLELLNAQGKGVRSLPEEAGALFAIGEGSGDKNPLWVVTGTKESGWEKVLAVLREEPASIYSAFSLVVYDGEVIRLPLLSEGE